MARAPRGITRAQLDELLEVTEQLADLGRRRDELRELVLRAHGDFRGTRVYGQVVLTLSEQKRFDPKAFAIAVPVTEHPEYYAATPAATAIPADVKAPFQNATPVLGVKRAE